MKDPAAVELHKYAAFETAERIRRFAFELNRSAKRADEEAIHDLRVSVRRLEQCLDLFEDLLPHRAAKKAHKRMRKVMQRAAEVRNRDIALTLLKESGVAGAKDVASSLAKERKQAASELTAQLRSLKEKEISRKWSVKLKVA